MTITFTRDHRADELVRPALDTLVSPANSPVAFARARERAEAGAVLVELYEYLKVNVWTHRSLASAIPVLSSAIVQYRTARSRDPFDGPRAVLASIQAERRTDPAIPDP